MTDQADKSDDRVDETETYEDVNSAKIKFADTRNQTRDVHHEIFSVLGMLESADDPLEDSRRSHPEGHWRQWHRHWHDWQEHHLHLWTNHKLPQRSSDAHAVARAEAASWAQMTPLIAATLGPLAVLLGIPSLSQRWAGQLLDPPVLSNGLINAQELPDPAFNTVLAIASLLCEVFGNTLLVLRFSNFHSKVMTWTSYAFWIAKIILGLINYIQFGITHPETDGRVYLQGFWVNPTFKKLIIVQIGVCSMGVTVIILIALTFNLAFLHGQNVIGSSPKNYLS